MRPRGCARIRTAGCAKSGEHAIRLILALPQPGVRRGQHDVEGGRLVVGEIELARRVDVRLDALQQPESTAVSRVDVVDGQPLRRGFGHRHPAGDLQSVRMVGDRRVLIASLNAGVGNLLDRRRAIAPFGVHLQITAVLLDGGASEGGIREHPPDLRAAQKVPPQLTPPLEYRRDARSVRWPVRRSAMRRSRESRGSRASNPVRCQEFAAARRRVRADRSTACPTRESPSAARL